VPLKQQVTDRVDDIRTRRPLLDHAVRTVQHYGAVKGSLQAGAVTYFAFLSFFPILALGFAAVGWIARYYPEARADLTDAIELVLPNMIGDGPGQVALSSIQDAAGAAVGFGLLGLLYSGLGWLSGMREALLTVFEKPRKLRDLVALVSLGLVMMLSVGVSGVVTSFSEEILEWLDLGTDLSWLLSGLSIVVGLLANMVLFFAFFKLLADPRVPSRSLWSGALVGAIGFEALKQASRYLLEATASQPAFQAFGIALILLVWINYFSRVVMYAASWAYTTKSARLSRRAEPSVAQLESGADRGALRPVGGPTVLGEPASRLSPKLAFGFGAATMLGLIAVLRKKGRGS